MRVETLNKIDELKVFLQTNNKSQIVDMSILITHIISEIIYRNGKVIIERSNGTMSQLVLPGLQND